jgi:hypothetical protein
MQTRSGIRKYRERRRRTVPIPNWTMEYRCSHGHKWTRVMLPKMRWLVEEADVGQLSHPDANLLTVSRFRCFNDFNSRTAAPE